MSEPEDFLSRWSRRKREVAEEAAAETAKPEASSAAEASASAGSENEPASQTAEVRDAEQPAFDISKLPSIAEITAETDIKPFLAAGVPAHLTQAALRKLWVTDPKIRDFIEIAENQWDFNAGNIPGFDYSLPENAKELVAQIFSKANDVVEKAGEPAPERAPVSATAQSEVSGEHDQADAALETAPDRTNPDAAHKDIEHGDKSARSESAEQQTEASDEPSSPLLPRRHGSALPT
jgi:hypothetical protein